MKTTGEIINILKTYKPEAERKYGFKRIGIFGSVARGEQHEGSDVDVCFEGPAIGLFTFVGIKMELEKLLNCSVDLVRERPNMDDILKNDIKRDAIYV